MDSISDVGTDFPARARPAVPIEVGRQCQGKLWSNLRDVCALLHIPCTDSISRKEILFQHVQYKTGQRVHLIGQTFDSFCIVNSGFLKTVAIDEFGNEQVLSFPMKGDVLGVDSICTKRFSSDAVALSDCNLILLPFKTMADLGHADPELEHSIYGVMSRELRRKEALVTILGAPNAEAKVARFLVSLAARYAEIGYSATVFNLRMTRQEIGSYLGLSLETVSRTLSALDDIGLISVNQRAITIHDREMLRALRRIPPSRSRVNSFMSGKPRANADWPRSVPASVVN